ncbi:hypothetical protein BDZ91DRAFT_731330, partial [Kalaharituber pfeilii]
SNPRHTNHKRPSSITSPTIFLSSCCYTSCCCGLLFGCSSCLFFELICCLFSILESWPNS